jgi:N-acyl-L-homoserine lactone synthetase
MEYVIRILKEKSDLAASYELRYKVYCREKHWVAPIDTATSIETDPYDNHSTHFGAFDNASRLAATVRLVTAPYARLPVYPAVKNLNIYDPESPAAEVSRFIVSTQHSSVVLFAGLLRSLYNYSKTSNINTWFYQTEARILNRLSHFNTAHSLIGQPYFYLGSEVQAAVLHVHEWEANLDRANPSLLSWLRQDSSRLDDRDHILCLLNGTAMH